MRLTNQFFGCVLSGVVKMSPRGAQNFANAPRPTAPEITGPSQREDTELARTHHDPGGISPPAGAAGLGRGHFSGLLDKCDRHGRLHTDHHSMCIQYFGHLSDVAKYAAHE